MKYKYTCIDEDEILDIYKNDPDFNEWFKIVKKILHSNEYQKRRVFRHHEFESVWNHSIKVSFNAFKFAKEHNLNFTLIATPAEGLSGRFVNIDRAMYGKIKGVTDRSYYTNSFHVPVYYSTSIKNKLETEAPYHKLTNGGHISYIELDGNTVMNVDAFESVIRMMKESGIGYGAINHPVDRDPVCGYVGVIGDVCPGCGRKEFDSVPLEEVRNFNCGC
jgi:anaerobic ribonucleoside-triphosphate reductase